MRAALFLLLLASPVAAQDASPYLPLSHWAMPYVEHLITRGRLTDPTPLTRPFRESDLLPAIATARARHEELAALREEAESLSEALAARKAIERAKGLLMEREGLTEQEAFARLRKASQISGRPLKVVADALIATLDATSL